MTCASVCTNPVDCAVAIALIVFMTVASVALAGLAWRAWRDA